MLSPKVVDWCARHDWCAYAVHDSDTLTVIDTQGEVWTFTSLRALFAWARY